jgi:hypothetical protein
MKRLTALLASIVFLAIAASATATGGGGDLVALASGKYGFSGTAAGSTFDVRPFTWKVKLRENGTVTGEYDYRQVRDGVELTVSGSLTCAHFEGNRVWVGGVIEESSRPSLVGLDMWFQAQDNGKGEPPDMSSTIGAGGPGTGQAYCDDHPEVRFPFFLDEGDLKVKTAE